MQDIICAWWLVVILKQFSSENHCSRQGFKKLCSVLHAVFFPFQVIALVNSLRVKIIPLTNFEYGSLLMLNQGRSYHTRICQPPPEIQKKYNY